ncbi:galactokinase [Gottfriedia acidiceleris]|uniref:galactokinase n=1 Tax=Gottfriedia acidiceleris TaxID=371036 RepID=UPI002F266E30
MDLSPLRKKFSDIFAIPHNRYFFAPGRINLIGEHTDYNGGNVFPCAITFGTYGLARKRDNDLIRLYSMNFPESGVIEFSLQDLDYNEEHTWANYPKGIIKFLLEENYQINSGVDILYYGNIPSGAGLSSSASIELVTGVIIDSLFELNVDRLKLVKIGKKVENEFIGVNSGIMDQFAIGMGSAGCGILLDCQTLKYEYAPIHLENHHLIIMNTNKRRELVSSKYNERRDECQQALAYIQKLIKIESLGQLTEQEFEMVKYMIKNETVRKRAKHVVYENHRTLKALKELKNNNLREFGELMNLSHISLRDDYEVTGLELDTLVEVAWQQPGVIGARMTGAGFGGCAIAIVEKERTQVFIENVGKVYKEKIGYETNFYIAGIGDGAKEITMEVLQ